MRWQTGLLKLGDMTGAEREWRFVIESLPASDSATMVAQRQLPTFCLYDRREYQKAADMVGGMLDEINQQMKKNKNLKLRYSGKEARKYLNRYRAQQNYFLACVEENQGKL